jgi:hypothetical protein
VVTQDVMGSLDLGDGGPVYAIEVAHAGRSHPQHLVVVAGDPKKAMPSGWSRMTGAPWRQPPEAGARDLYGGSSETI